MKININPFLLFGLSYGFKVINLKYSASPDLWIFHFPKIVNKSGFGHESGESPQIKSVGDFIQTMFSRIGSNV